MSGGPTLAERLRAQRERHLLRPRIVRALIVAGGFTVLLGGVAMLVLPGPAFAVIPIGLGILSLEFVWAERLLEHALEQAERAKASAKRRTPAERAMIVTAVVCAAAAAIAAAVLWDIPLLPV